MAINKGFSAFRVSHHSIALFTVQTQRGELEKAKKKCRLQEFKDECGGAQNLLDSPVTLALAEAEIGCNSSRAHDQSQYLFCASFSCIESNATGLASSQVGPQLRICCSVNVSSLDNLAP